MRHLPLLLVVLAAGPALADPATTSTTAPSTTPPTNGSLMLTPLLLVELPQLPVPSLRLEALRVAGQRADNDWRYPEPGPLLGVDGDLWWMGYGHYRPRTARSAALHTGSIAATMAGQILLSADSPVAGIGALLTGATLDAAGADVDRDAESRRH